MGVVYEAYDPALDRTLALKTILLAFAVSPQEQVAFERRFFTEARIAAKLRHPGIVVVHDMGRDEATGTLFIAFEHLLGRTLAEVANAGPLPWREALRIGREAALALNHAHSHGVVHRDIKPANIMLLGNGEAKIMDFGIAKVKASQLTAAGQVFGTPANMAPEQAQGGQVDARSDLFSLGTVLYQLLTGRCAFAGDTLAQILVQVMQEDPAPPSHVVAAIPAGVDYVIARMLAKDPAARYPNGAVLADDIEDVLSGGPPRHRPGWMHATRPAAHAAAGGTLVSSLLETAERPAAPTLDLAAELGAPVPQEPAAAAAAPAPAAIGTPRKPRRLAAAATFVLAIALAAFFGVRHVREAAPPAGVARLVIDFEHTLKDGTFKLWLDDELVVDADLSGRVTKNILGLKLRKGSLEHILDVQPGSHAFRVSVAWDDNVREQHTRGSFEPGATRQLEIQLGRLLKDLSLRWK